MWKIFFLVPSKRNLSQEKLSNNKLSNFAKLQFWDGRVYKNTIWHLTTCKICVLVIFSIPNLQFFKITWLFIVSASLVRGLLSEQEKMFYTFGQKDSVTICVNFNFYNFSTLNKQTYARKGCNLLHSFILMVLLSLPFNKLPFSSQLCTHQYIQEWRSVCLGWDIFYMDCYSWPSSAA